jgi:hypothetical protein
LSITLPKLISKYSNNVGVNIADATNAADNQCTYTLSGLSTEIEGLKLNTIITESNILSKVQSNNQAIEQIRHDLDSIKSQQSKSNFTSDNNISPITNSEPINVGPIANSTKIDSTATIPICKHGSKRSCIRCRYIYRSGPVSDTDTFIRCRYIYRSGPVSDADTFIEDLNNVPWHSSK